VARLSALLDADIRQFTNQWKPVQSYYSIYFHLVTLHFVVNGKVLKRHEPTLRWATQSILGWFPVPWSLRLDYTGGTLHNFPAGTAMWANGGWNLRNNEPYFHVANFFRRTAQRNQREDWREHYRRNKKRRTFSGASAGGPTTLRPTPSSKAASFSRTPSSSTTVSTTSWRRQLSRSRASSAATLAPGRYTLSTKSSWRSRTAISTPPQSSDGGTLSVA
jgi:hypothetical protein